MVGSEDAAQWASDGRTSRTLISESISRYDTHLRRILRYATHLRDHLQYATHLREHLQVGLHSSVGSMLCSDVGDTGCVLPK